MRKVSFTIANLVVDKIVAIDGAPLQVALTARDYIYGDPQPTFWIEPASNGDASFCTNVPDLTDVVLTMADANNIEYEVHAKDFVGGRPIVIK